MGQRAAAAHAACDHHLRAKPCQKPDGRVVDIGIERLLRAAGHQRDPHPARALCRKDLGVVVAADRRDLGRRHVQHRAQPLVRHQPLEWPPDLRAEQRKAEAPRIGQDPRQHPTQGTVLPWSLVILFDIGPGVIDEMHVMHARRAGRHASEAGQAAVDMLDRLLVRHALVLEHVLDEIDPPTRRIELVAQHLVGRAGRGAETAMHASAQDLVRALEIGVLQLLGAKFGLHGGF